jgi:hypothetical protein
MPRCRRSDAVATSLKRDPKSGQNAAAVNLPLMF